jgi:predicted negative regulator of RcsB-dependent stress response
MNEYLSDKEQIELFKKWWKDYGRGIALAVIVGLGVGFAWRYWHSRQIQNEANASELYQQALFFDEKGDVTSAAQNATKLSDQFPSSPYSALAALLLAKDAVANNNLTMALVKLNWVIANSKEARLRQIARIRAARIFTAQKQFDQATAILARIDDKAFSPMIAEVRGDILTAQGRKMEAGKEYDLAKKGMQDAGVQDPLLQMKIAG